jgi:ribokinase
MTPSLHRPVRVVVVGSSNTDLVLTCDRLPKPGETLLGSEFQQFAGGKGANQAVAAARAGARVTFIGAHGNDDFGRAAKAGLKREGIDVRQFRQVAGISSGIALILIGGRDRQNLIAVAKSANDRVKDIRLPKADAVVAQLEIPLPAVMEAARQAHAAGIPFILNPAPARKLPASLLRLIHTLVPNEHEVRILAGGGEGPPPSGGRRSVGAAARHLRTLGVQNVVVTLGGRGAMMVDDDGERVIPAPKVRPVDTVGAGDCFTAWLAVGIAEKLPLAQAVARACRAAALAVTRPGAQAGMPWRREVMRPLPQECEISR